MAKRTLLTALGDEPLAPLILARQVDARRILCIGRVVVQWRVPALLEILHRDGREASWLPIQAVDVPAGLAELRRQLPPLIDDRMIFDLTNAHGVVGFALYELARQYDRAQPDRTRLVRVDWSDRLIRSVSPDHVTTAEPCIQVSLREFLELHGKRLLGVERARGSVGTFGRAAYRIAAGLEAAQPLLEAVHHGNWERPLRLPPAMRHAKLIAELTDDGLLRRDGSALFATSLRAFQFLHGRWLEEYLFEVADQSGEFQDCASGLRFTWVENGDVANEIDFAGMAGGRATVASCKTGLREVAATLYELLTLAERAAGRSVVAVFATSESLDRPARHRAAALGIHILDAERLRDPRRVLATLLGDPGRRGSS